MFWYFWKLLLNVLDEQVFFCMILNLGGFSNIHHWTFYISKRISSPITKLFFSDWGVFSLHQLCSHTGKGIVAISAVVSLGVGGESDDDGRRDSSSLKGKAGLELARVPRVPGNRQNSKHHLWHPRILRFLIVTGTRRARSMWQVALDEFR